MGLNSRSDRPHHLLEWTACERTTILLEVAMHARLAQARSKSYHVCISAAIISIMPEDFRTPIRLIYLTKHRSGPAP